MNDTPREKDRWGYDVLRDDEKGAGYYADHVPDVPDADGDERN